MSQKAAHPSKDRVDRIALYVDLENFVGFCLALGLPLDLAPELSRLTELGKVTIRRSFGDIYKLPLNSTQKADLRRMLQQNLILHEDIPHYNAFKNTSDIRLVIEALSHAYTNDDIDTVAIVASDRDYLPLFAKLREIGKEIIGIGGNRDNTPELYVKACDYFFYHETIAGGALPGLPIADKETTGAQAGTPIVQTKQTPPDATQAVVIDEALRLLVDALKALESQGSAEGTGYSVVRMMRRIKPDFDFPDYGYGNLKHLVEKAITLGLVRTGDQGVVVLAPTVSQEKTPIPPQPTSGPHEVSPFSDWYEQKTGIKLPSYDQRKTVYEKLLRCMEAIEPEKGTSLNTLSIQIKNACRGATIPQAVSYKILYSLYRANCFSCTPGDGPFNPVVLRMRREVTVEDLDTSFIENTLRVHKRESHTVIDPLDCSLALYGTIGREEHIREIAQSV